jgi:hypothetical protein
MSMSQPKAIQHTGKYALVRYNENGSSEVVWVDNPQLASHYETSAQAILEMAIYNLDRQAVVVTVSPDYGHNGG